MTLINTLPVSAYDHQPVFNHTPLIDPRNFRLLQLHPSRQPGSIRGFVHEIPVSIRPPYVALSYEWGDADGYHLIQINDCDFKVRANLFDILTEYAKRIYNRCYLFVDAICIDQSNEAERNAQVRLMGKIFQQAKEVSAWIRPPPDFLEVGSLFNFIDWCGESRHLIFESAFEWSGGSPPRLVENKVNFEPCRYDVKFTCELKCGGRTARRHLPRLITHSLSLPTGESICRHEDIRDGDDDSIKYFGLRSGSIEEYQCLRCIFLQLSECRYWSRMWVVQEFALGKKVSLNCGPHSTSAECLHHAIGTGEFDSRLRRHRFRSRNSPCFWFPRLRWHIQEFRNHGRQAEHGKLGLFGLLETTEEQSCANWQDRVYALLGCLINGDTFPVDYTQSRLGLFLSVLTFERQQSNTIWHSSTIEDLLSLASLLELPFEVSPSDTTKEIEQLGISKQSLRWSAIGRGSLIEVQCCKTGNHRRSDMKDVQTLFKVKDETWGRHTHTEGALWATYAELAPDDQFVYLSGFLPYSSTNVGLILRPEISSGRQHNCSIVALAEPIEPSPSSRPGSWCSRTSMEVMKILQRGNVVADGDEMLLELPLGDFVELILLMRRGKKESGTISEYLSGLRWRQ